MTRLRLDLGPFAFVLLAVFLSACGGGSGGGHHDLAATKSCLDGKSLNASTSKDDLDYVAQAAGEGGIYVRFSDAQNATLAFERTENDAKNTETAYKTFVEGFGGTVGNTIKRDGNVVLAWNKEPTDEERSKIEDCL